MKTMLTTQPSSLLADGTLNLHVPHSWGELTQDQLRYVLYLLTQGWQEWQVRTYLFARFAGIEVLNEKKDGWLSQTQLDSGKTVRFFLQLWQVQDFCQAFDYIFDGKGADNRSIISGFSKPPTSSCTSTHFNITSSPTTTSSSSCSQTSRATHRSER